MSETSEIEAAVDEGESAGEMQPNSHDGLVAVFDSPAPSTAVSMTETIDSREEVYYCQEWELFSDTDQRDASDNEDSTEDHSDEEDDQSAPACVDSDLQHTATDIRIESALVLERSQQDDTERQAYVALVDDANHVPQSPLCKTASSTIDNNGKFAPSSAAQEERPISQCEDAGMRQRIQVVVRVRPPLDSEGKVVVTAGGKEGTGLCVQATTSQGSISTVTECTFDRVFMGNSTQEDVFAAIEPSVLACLEGYNATVFAYGQTGTGKTHTLFGRDFGLPKDNDAIQGPEQGENGSFQLVKSSWGIVPRTLNYLLDQASILKQKNCQVELHVSFLQIYNDRLYDLLTDRMRQKPLLIREQPTLEGTTSVAVQGLSSERVTSFSSAMQIIHQGHTNRCVRETESNLASSRSHAIVQLHVTTQCPAPTSESPQILRRARLNLVDLAGSEKWNTDVEMEDAHSQELKNINTSLSALGNCIAALTEAGRRHIPYRDSTLTRVLQDSFGGNTKSCLIATINATQQACEETIRTLHFSDRARSVMQTIRVNEEADGSTELLMAKIQIVKLRERLESEQRRRHETRLKEQQAMQREFQEKLKGKDKEITKLTRDNAVFQRWREEDTKKIRALECRIKDLEQQSDSIDDRNSEPLTNSVTSTFVQVSKRQSAVSPSISAAKRSPVQKIRSRANLTRAGSENGTAARTYKQVLERYALGSTCSKGQQVKSSHTSKVAFDQVQQNSSSYDATNQHEEPTEHQPPAPDMSLQTNQQPRWGAASDDNRGSDSLDLGRPDVTRFQASGLCVSPVLCRSSENTTTVAQTSSTKNSWTYSNLASSTTNFSSDWTSSMLSKSTPAMLIQKQEVNDRSEARTSVPRHNPVSLLKNASTGSFSYSYSHNSPMRTSAAACAIEPCQKHKLAGCMLCSVNGQTPAAPARQPATTTAMASTLREVARNPQDGPCERHQLLRCFICMKNSTVGSAVQAAATTSSTCAASSSYLSGKTLSYQDPPLKGETQSKCALHSLANCILCAGIKAMTRKAMIPTPQASPAKTTSVLDANHADDRIADRYRRYTLDERIINYQTQPKLANQW